MLLETVCNITMSFRWQGIGEQELPRLKLYNELNKTAVLKT